MFNKLLQSIFFTAVLLLASVSSLSAQSEKSSTDTTIIRIKTDAIKQVLQTLKQTQDELEKNLNDSNLTANAKKDINQAIDQIGEEMEKLQDRLSRMADELAEDVETMTDDADSNSNSINKSDTNDIKIIEIGDGKIVIRTSGDKNHDSHSGSNNEIDLPAVKTQVLGLELGSQFLENSGTADLTLAGSPMELSYPKSLNISLYLIREGFSLINHYLYATTGIGIDFHEYRFRNDITLVSKTTPLQVAESTVKFEKNKLSAHYLMIPLMLHMETNPRHPNKSFKLAAGGYAELLLKSYTKQVSEEEGKIHVKDNFNLNNLNYGLAANIGFGAIQFYTHYSLTPMFKPDKGPEASIPEIGQLYPLTFGIVLNGFKWVD
jgi:hypothetical protein